MGQKGNDDFISYGTGKNVDIDFSYINPKKLQEKLIDFYYKHKIY